MQKNLKSLFKKLDPHYLPFYNHTSFSRYKWSQWIKKYFEDKQKDWKNIKPQIKIQLFHTYFISKHTNWFHPTNFLQYNRFKYNFNSSGNLPKKTSLSPNGFFPPPSLLLTSHKHFETTFLLRWTRLKGWFFRSSTIFQHSDSLSHRFWAVCPSPSFKEISAPASTKVRVKAASPSSQAKCNNRFVCKAASFKVSAEAPIKKIVKKGKIKKISKHINSRNKVFNQKTILTKLHYS